MNSRQALLIALAFVLGVTAGLVGWLLVAALSDGGQTAVGGQPRASRVDELRQMIHEHADFAVYVRGRQIDFGQPEYLEAGEREEEADAHLHLPRATVVHVHRDQTTWHEFFESLGVDLTDSCPRSPAGGEFCRSEHEDLRFMANGVSVDSILFLSTGDLDRVLVSLGAADDAELMAQFATVSDEACIPSGLCLDRVDPDNPEEEPCRRAEGGCH